MNVLPEAYLSLFKGNPVLSYDSDIYWLIFFIYTCTTILLSLLWLTHLKYNLKIWKLSQPVRIFQSLSNSSLHQWKSEK